MELIKLDNEDYINTEAVDSIKSGDDPYLVMRCGDVIIITPADRDRIVAAMSRPDFADNPLDNINEFGNGYQTMRGYALIASLTDDAMQDEPISASYPRISEIVPDKMYRAEVEASNMTGEFEEAD